MNTSQKQTPNRFRVLSVLLPAFFFLLAGITGPLSVQAQSTPWQEPTPLPDGKVLYEVQEGDTLWSISAVTGVSIDELERLNNIRREDPLEVGSVLLLKIVVPESTEPTLAFQPTPTPTQLPVTGEGTICISFFNDINGDASHAVDTEGLVAGGQVSVALASGAEVGNVTSDGIEPYCFRDIPSGEYTIAAAVPEGYNPTSEMNQRRLLEPGETVYVSFAVQSRESGGGAQDGVGSPILAIAGLVLLGGAGLVLYYFLRPRRRTRW